eukprot:TRINITY_DN6186_c0_g2_i2.p1 TRINITY_DN6186_c0_g2~~TRINITY_DN6186_c0_g2_i2.p1  ORF type:complete len:140 (+),score=2.74 TRINITY_DN6186_c0_g2_i2:231-650(+)
MNFRSYSFILPNTPSPFPFPTSNTLSAFQSFLSDTTNLIETQDKATLNDELDTLRKLIISHTPDFSSLQFEYSQNNSNEDIKSLTVSTSLPPLNVAGKGGWRNGERRSREMKIRRYKEKLRGWREMHPCLLYTSPSPRD